MVLTRQDGISIQHCPQWKIVQREIIHMNNVKRMSVFVCVSHDDSDYDSDSEEGDGRGQPKKLACGCRSGDSSFPTEGLG